MYNIYDNGYKITANPVSYNHILKVLFRDAKIDCQKLSTLKFGDKYSFETYIFVRAL